MTPGLIPSAPAPVEPTAFKEDRFRYGRRLVSQRRPDGGEELMEVPLTLEDVLHPQEGDQITESTFHEFDCGYLSWVFRARLFRLTGGLVLSDCLIDWNVPDQRDTAPDVVVFTDVPSPVQQADMGTFRPADCGARPLLALELVSPETRNNDVVRKVEEYHRAGVPLYLLVDQERVQGPRRVLAYRHTPEDYQPLPPDADGRWLLAELGLRIGLRDNRIACFDADSGELLGDPAQTAQELKANRLALRAEVLARQEAEHVARIALAAQLATEEHARAETAARQAAEQARQAEVAARQAAEQARQAEAAARQAAEQRTQALEAELRRLRGDPPSP